MSRSTDWTSSCRRLSIFFRRAEAYIAQLNKARVFDGAIVAKIEPNKAFYPADSLSSGFSGSTPEPPLYRCQRPAEDRRAQAPFSRPLSARPPSANELIATLGTRLLTALSLSRLCGQFLEVAHAAPGQAAADGRATHAGHWMREPTRALDHQTSLSGCPILSSQTGTAHFKPRLWSRAALPFRSDRTSKVSRRACRHPRLRQVPDH